MNNASGTEAKRDKAKKYIEKCGIRLIGRFGEWEYLWNDQSYLSGRKGAKVY